MRSCHASLGVLRIFNPFSRRNNGKPFTCYKQGDCRVILEFEKDQSGDKGDRLARSSNGCKTTMKRGPM